MPTLRAIAADVGGTNTKIALAEFDDARPRVIARQVYRSAEYAGLDAIVQTFMRESAAPRISAACFAVAGPVEHGHAKLTNLPWQLEQNALAQRLGFPVRLINDFAAAALGVEHLAADDLMTLQQGTTIERASRVVVGAGTGLGVGVLEWTEEGYRVYPSEGGHCDFAPVNEVQDQLLMHLRREFPHVSSERIVSGPGLPRIVAFLTASGATPTHALSEAMRRRDPSEAITEFALGKLDDVAVRALDIFAAAYGAFAGNMALVTLAHGGVYIAGGIAPKISAKLGDGTFMRAFTAKGRMGKLLETMPVRVVLNEQAGLYGALSEAARAGAREAPDI